MAFTHRDVPSQLKGVIKIVDNYRYKVYIVGPKDPNLQLGFLLGKQVFVSQKVSTLCARNAKKFGEKFSFWNR